MNTTLTDPITYNLMAGTAATADPQGFVINRTWANATITFTGLVVNAINFGSAAGSLLADFKLGNVTKASIDKNGSLAVGNISAIGVIYTNGGNSDQWNSVSEYYQSMVAIASGGSTVNTNNVVKNITSLVLPAGDWNVQGMFGLQPSGATSITGNIGGIGTTSATFDLGWEVYGSPGSLVTSGTIPTRRFSFTVPTTVYLYSRIDFASGSPKTFGWMTACRVR
jgi:hypothetical protein